MQLSNLLLVLPPGNKRTQPIVKGKREREFDNLLNQNFCVKEKNKVWCTDFTYMCQNNGRTRYNCTIIDLYDRSVIAFVNDEHINTELAIATLRESLNAEKIQRD